MLPEKGRQKKSQNYSTPHPSVSPLVCPSAPRPLPSSRFLSRLWRASKANDDQLQGSCNASQLRPNAVVSSVLPQLRTSLPAVNKYFFRIKLAPSSTPLFCRSLGALDIQLLRVSLRPILSERFRPWKSPCRAKIETFRVKMPSFPNRDEIGKPPSKTGKTNVC